MSMVSGADMTSQSRRPGRQPLPRRNPHASQAPVRLLAATVISAASLTLAAAPVSAATQHLNGTQAASAAPTPMCLDATDNRANGTAVRLWTCVNHRNQKWVIQGGQVKVEDTLS
ncbi:hypothetical protein AB0L53_24120 [Nonomuraea sp. NPDC052129]|uniref:hypothetical protein n=1 Tax=Nonomuraea sp. NPDC052129 TaxID=3154651 RepID=UPI0034163624